MCPGPATNWDHLSQAEDLVFRQKPVLKDCYPMSTKEHKIVEHESGQQLQVPCAAEYFLSPEHLHTPACFIQDPKLYSV